MKQETDNIDSLFKAGFDNADSNNLFREEDWNAIEDMLNGAENKPAVFIKRLPLIISAVAALLILITGAIFFNYDSKTNDRARQQARNPPPPNKTKRRYGQAGQQQIYAPGIDTPANGDKSQLNATNRGHKSKPFPAFSLPATGHKNAGHEINVSVPYSYYPAQTSITNIRPDTLVNDKPVALARTDHVADQALPEQADTTDKATYIDREVRQKNTPEIYAAKTGPRFTLTFIASPDLNGVGSFSQNKVGTSAGILLSVGLSKKWSVTTGVAYADKPYATNFANYKTAYPFSTDPQSVSANCLVIDIPLNVNYMFYHKNNNKFSLGTGLSSYFMLRENYTFNYAGYNNQNPTTYNIANKNRHLFGVLNLNATYQRAVSSKFEIGIQPYLKLPLTSIGYGHVDLRSAGLAVGVIWNINPHTKP